MTNPSFEKITEIKSRMGKKLTIMGHHYQHDTVIRHTDLRGDSLELARKTAEVEAEHIVFCGVYFMGESSALLSRPGQKVYLPEPDANCVMSQMAPAERVESVFSRLAERGRRIVPLTYVNSSVAVKAVVGKHGGSVCTSANAKKMLEWAFEQGDAVLFIPDKNLASNTADILGLPEDRRHILDIRKGGTAIDFEAADKATLLMWPGCCAIHARFNLRQISRMREEHHGIRIVVHPECSQEVVHMSDAAGSTSFIIKYVDEAPEGATIAVGTEINLVERLAKQYAGKKTIMPLLESACTHMNSVTEEKLASTLLAVEAGTYEPVMVPMEMQDNARVALERMLKACA
ncbi:quinolinate synthase NadA [Oleidesulfovibrio sp.]|uniref:quinolinate synthase NadA n=1 Tax=Oleidesulfovibrio sp. TaxID=2909707 RepID=UPI003A848C2A